MSSNKKKVLCLFDYVSSTGFGTVARHIVTELYKTNRYECDIVGINHKGTPYDQDKWPGRVWPALIPLSPQYQNNMYGIPVLLDLLNQGDYDIIFTIQDTFIVESFVDQMLEIIAEKQKQPATIFYYPIDAVPRQNWIQTADKFDYPVVYTEYGYDQSVTFWPQIEEKLEVIYHGHDFGEIFHIEDPEGKILPDFRTKYFKGFADNKFLVMNLNRNQWRKDIIRTFMILAQLKEWGHEDFHFYMHMAADDVGGNIIEMAENFGLVPQEDYSSPGAFDASTGLDISIVNHLYNCSDCILTSTYGEGWGLSITEGISCKTPIVAPDNTSIHEILDNNRGILIPSGETPSAWVSIGRMDNHRMRPLMNIEGAAQALVDLKEGTRVPDVEGAHEWLQELSWEKVCKKWIDIFDRAEPRIKEAPIANGGPGFNRAERRRLEREAQKAAKKAK